MKFTNSLITWEVHIDSIFTESSVLKAWQEVLFFLIWLKYLSVHASTRGCVFTYVISWGHKVWKKIMILHLLIVLLCFEWTSLNCTYMSLFLCMCVSLSHNPALISSAKWLGGEPSQDFTSNGRKFLWWRSLLRVRD